MRLTVLTIITVILSVQYATANNLRQRQYLRTLSGNGQQVTPNVGLPQQRTLLSNSESYGQNQQQLQQSQFPVSQKNTYSSNEVVSTQDNGGLNSRFQERTEPVINEEKVKETLQNAFSSRIVNQPMLDLQERQQQLQIQDQPRLRVDSRITVTTTAPIVTTHETSSTFVNPCTAEVLRMSDIMLFRDPTDRRSYLICTDVETFHSMPCPEGTIFNDDLHHCVPEGYEAPKCPDTFCKNDADCLVDETNNFKCICKVGFTGQFCETNIDECALGGNQACAGGQCVDQINGYYCIFRNGLIGLRQDTAIANPCTVDNFSKETYFFEVPSVNGDVWLQCIGESQFVVSRCAEHLFWNSELQTCTIERPSAKSGVCTQLPCKNGGECQDLGNSQFQCECRPGFTGQFCESVVDLCLSNPCANGGRCLSWTGGFTCVCQNKIIDETCTSGLNNPCPSGFNLKPGFNDYFAHTSPERYLQCDKDGRAFARSCPTGLKWRQDKLSCVPASFIMTQEVRATTVASVRSLVTPKMNPQFNGNFAQEVTTPRVMINKETNVPKIPNQMLQTSMRMAQTQQQFQPQLNENFVSLDQQTLKDNVNQQDSSVQFTKIGNIQLDDTLNQTNGLSKTQRIQPNIQFDNKQDLRQFDEINRVQQQVIPKTRPSFINNDQIKNDNLNQQQLFQIQQQQPQQNQGRLFNDKPLRYRNQRA